MSLRLSTQPCIGREIRFAGTVSGSRMFVYLFVVRLVSSAVEFLNGETFGGDDDSDERQSLFALVVQFWELWTGQLCGCLDMIENDKEQSDAVQRVGEKHEEVFEGLRELILGEMLRPDEFLVEMVSGTELENKYRVEWDGTRDVKESRRKSELIKLLQKLWWGLMKLDTEVNINI